MGIRDNLRSKAASGKFRTKIVEVDGERVLVKQPSVRGRRDLMNKATKENGQVGTRFSPNSNLSISFYRIAATIV